MRLLELKQTLENTVAKLDSLSIADPDKTNNRVKISNLKEVRFAIEELAATGLFATEVEKLRGSAIFETLSNTFLVPAGTVDILKLRIGELRLSISNLLGALSSFESDSPDVIALRLPPTTNFDELVWIGNELKKCISIPIADPQIGGEVKIQSVDNGSIWLYIALGTPAALTLVAGLAWAGAVIYKKIQEGQAFKAYVDNLNMKNEQTELFLEAQRAQVTALIIEQAREVEKANFTESDPERIERLKLSIGTIAELTNNGFEIHPSILAPENVKNLFPDFKTLHLPSFSHKQITDGEEEKSST